MEFTAKEQLFLKNLVEDKIDLAEKHIKKFERDYKYYTEDRAKWIPGTTLGSPDSNYAKEIRRQIDLEKNKISEYAAIIEKILA